MIGFPLTRRDLVRAGALAPAGAALWPYELSAAGNVLTVRVETDLNTLDPINMVTRNDLDVATTIFNSLVKNKSGSEWGFVNDAAVEIEQVDATHITFTLRPDIGWTNGFGEMTTADIKFSFERIANPANQSPYQSDWATLDHVDVIDDRRGVIVLSEPFVPLWQNTLPYSSGLIMCKRAVEAAGGTFTTEVPASSGPYVIMEWIPQQKIVLARNPDFSIYAADFDEIHLVSIPDSKIGEIAFEAGEVDYTQVSMSSIPRLRAGLDANEALTEKPSTTFWWIGMNTDHELFREQRVRKAVQYAVDCDAILEAAFFGVAERSTGIATPGITGHRDANLIDHRDIDKARALLSEAGRGDGFSTTITVLSETDRVAACQVIQANLAEIGIEVEILTYDPGTYWTLGLEEEGEAWRDLQLMLLRFTSTPDPSYGLQWFTPSQVGIWNWERWNSPEFGELYKQSVIELDAAKRNAILTRMQDLMEESGAYIFLTHGVNAALNNQRIVPASAPDLGISLREFRMA